MGKGNGMNTYTTTINDYVCIALGFEFKGDGFTGLDCAYKPPFDCKGKKTKKNGATNELIFFSNGNKTILLATHGNSLNEETKKEITNSFKFL